MDITFKTPEGCFNYRACAVIINDNRILAMIDDPSSHYYLPGGRVNMHERIEDAVLRELKEELFIDAKIVRPLWVNQGFFIAGDENEKYHEICIYFLVDISCTNILSRGKEFEIIEGKNRHFFKWIPFEELEDTYFFPLFIKKEIFNLPKHLTLHTEIEY